MGGQSSWATKSIGSLQGSSGTNRMSLESWYTEVSRMWAEYMQDSSRTEVCEEMVFKIQGLHEEKGRSDQKAGRIHHSTVGHRTG